MRSRRTLALAVSVALLALLVYAAAPYVQAASLVIRAADLGGTTEALASRLAHDVETSPPRTIPTRHGDVAARFYLPSAEPRRTVLLIPGIHALGIDEPRLTALARELAATGLRVVTVALPDLQRYRITLRSTDVIEDVVSWLAAQPPGEPVGIIGISFAGGLAISAASRPSVRDRVAYVVAFGGHGDLRRVMRYLVTGEAPAVEGVELHPPHDYGVAVTLSELAHRVVPPEQVEPLREGIATFLLASQQTLVDRAAARETFERARQIQQELPEPASTYMGYVNDRAVPALGALLEPHLDQLGADAPALSPQLAAPPSAPVFLLHGADDTIIPPAESVLLARHLDAAGADVRVLLSGVITHAQANRAAAWREVWQLVAFWADVLRH